LQELKVLANSVQYEVLNGEFSISEQASTHGKPLEKAGHNFIFEGHLGI
jgi:hypothetical protein